eukprot:2659808-Amphidinium_carterae.4
MHSDACHSDGAYKTLVHDSWGGPLGHRHGGWKPFPFAQQQAESAASAPVLPAWTEHPHFKTFYVAQSREQSNKRKADESSEDHEDEEEEIRPQKKSSASSPTSLRRTLLCHSKASASVQLQAKPKAQSKVLVKKIERLGAKEAG